MRLILERGGERLAVELRDGVYTLGRDDSADIAIPNNTVSSRHAELQVSGTSCTLRDLGSSNGTTVNGVRIRGAQRIEPNDDIQLGSARLAIELPGQASSLPIGDTSEYRPTAAREEAAAPREKWSWGVRLWLAGAIAISVFALLMLVVEFYSQADARRVRRVGRYMAFAAQYIQPLQQVPLGSVPPPVNTYGLAEPFFVLDSRGRIVMPPPQPGQPERPSPVVDEKTKSIPGRRKLDLDRIELPSKDGPPQRAYSYPVRHGGELLGYVVARPGTVESNLPLIFLMVACTTGVALLALFFAIRPVMTEIRGHIAALTEKLSPFAHGFAEALPRSATVPELNELATECETVLRSISRGQPAAAAPVSVQGQQYGAMLTPLLEAAALPYCFISNDFQLLAASPDLLTFTEFTKARVGTSIFEGGLNSMQSKQLVGAINEARVNGQGRATITLLRGGLAYSYVAHVRRLQESMRGYGLLFAVQPAQS
jgi:hypothetical protein